MLECFAYYKETPNGGLRCGTLIICNGDEHVIGNAVLKNPGSASPVSSLFSQREDGRMEFSLDATMFALADLFQLNQCSGTIRLFNLFDVRDVVPGMALAKLDDESCLDGDIAEQLARLPGLPTYLGWGELWKNSVLFERARKIFYQVLPENPCLNSSMKNNPFFHPLYLMRYGRYRKDCCELIQAFRKCL